jgi:hypothetical protein
MEMSIQLHASAALIRGKSPRYPLNRRLGGPQSRSGDCGVNKNCLSVPGIEPRPSSLLHAPMLTELFRLVVFN